MNHVHISTNEGADSFALATPEFLMHGWLEGPVAIAGEVDALGYEADKILKGTRKPFMFAGSRRQLLSLVRQSHSATRVLTDKRLVIEPTERQRTEMCMREVADE